MKIIRAFFLFPLIKLAKKLKDVVRAEMRVSGTFPLIKLAKKLKEALEAMMTFLQSSCFH